MRLLTLFTAYVSTVVILTITSVTARPGDVANDRSGEHREFNAQDSTLSLKAYEDSVKYFHEPGEDDLLGHYDTRYYKELLSYEDKRDAQVRMIRAYLNTFHTKGLETWIAHGTLLGWWWNGKVCHPKG